MLCGGVSNLYLSLFRLLWTRLVREKMRSSAQFGG